MSYTKVTPTAAEVAEFTKAKGRKPSVGMVACTHCGKRIWNSGLGRGAHSRSKSCAGNQTASPRQHSRETEKKMDTTANTIEVGQRYRSVDSGHIVIVTRVTPAPGFVYATNETDGFCGAYLSEDFAEAVAEGRLVPVEPSPARIANVLADWEGRKIVLPGGRVATVGEHDRDNRMVRLACVRGLSIDAAWYPDVDIWNGLENGTILTPDQITAQAKADAPTVYAPKIGDRVAITGGLRAGRTGTVDKTGEYSSGVRVKLDKPLTSGGRVRKAVWIFPVDLALLPAAN